MEVWLVLDCVFIMWGAVVVGKWLKSPFVCYRDCHQSCSSGNPRAGVFVCQGCQLKKEFKSACTCLPIDAPARESPCFTFPFQTNLFLFHPTWCEDI